MAWGCDVVLQGIVVRWNRERGFGFIKTDGASGDVFLHISQWPQGAGAPRSGVQVSFVIVNDEQGRARAEQVSVLGVTTVPTAHKKSQTANTKSVSKPAASSPIPYTRLAAIIGALILVAALAYAYSKGSAASGVWLGMWYLGISAVTFAAFGWDKMQAQAGGWRTRENTLHTLALLGGWPGGLLAMRLFRHKTRKLSFQLLFWLAVIANVYVLSGDQLGLLGNWRVR